MAKKRNTKSQKPARETAVTVRMVEGLVVRNNGNTYGVLPLAQRPNAATSLTIALGETEIEARVKGKFRLKGIRTTNPVAVGDRVEVAVNSDGTAYITAIRDRSNYIIRRASNLSKEASILAANIDQACLVVTLRHPSTSTTFIDRFLATCEAYRVPAIIVINKTDLLELQSSNPDPADPSEDDRFEAEDTDMDLLDAFSYLYESIGYKVVKISAATGEGVPELEAQLKGKITLLAGNSGVGKSTLINRLIPGLDLRTGEISQVHDTGMHTTTFSEMFPLPQGGWIIDTPGVRGFGTIEFDKNEVGHFFPEIFRASKHCRYGDCTHTHEPQCAVIEAVEKHHISQSRYNSYLSILEDADPDTGKYRKPY